MLFGAEFPDARTNARALIKPGQSSTLDRMREKLKQKKQNEQNEKARITKAANKKNIDHFMVGTLLDRAIEKRDDGAICKVLQSCDNLHDETAARVVALPSFERLIRHIQEVDDPRVIMQLDAFIDQHKTVFKAQHVAVPDYTDLIYQRTVDLPFEKQISIIPALFKNRSHIRLAQRLIKQSATRYNGQQMTHLFEKAIETCGICLKDDPAYQEHLFALYSAKHQVAPLNKEETKAALLCLDSFEYKRKAHELALLHEEGKFVEKSFVYAIDCWFSVWSAALQANDVPAHDNVVAHVAHLAQQIIKDQGKEAQKLESTEQYLKLLYKASMILSIQAHHFCYMLFEMAEDHLARITDPERKRALCQIAGLTECVDYIKRLSVDNNGPLCNAMLATYHYNRASIEPDNAAHHFEQAIEYAKKLQKNKVALEGKRFNVSDLEYQCAQHYLTIGETQKGQKLLESAAHAKHVQAQLELGKLYFKAQAQLTGLPAIEKGIGWITLAMLGGNQEAARIIASCVKNGAIRPLAGTFIGPQLIQRAKKSLDFMRARQPMEPTSTDDKEVRILGFDTELQEGIQLLQNFDYAAAYPFFKKFNNSPNNFTFMLSHAYCAVMSAHGLGTGQSADDALVHIRMIRERTPARNRKPLNYPWDTAQYVARHLAGHGNMHAACEYVHFALDVMDASSWLKNNKNQWIFRDAFALINAVIAHEPQQKQIFFSSGILERIIRNPDFEHDISVALHMLEYCNASSEPLPAPIEKLLSNIENELQTHIGYAVFKPLFILDQQTQNNLLLCFEKTARAHPDQNIVKRIVLLLKFWHLVHSATKKPADIMKVIHEIEALSKTDIRAKVLLAFICLGGNDSYKAIPFQKGKSLALFEQAAQEGDSQACAILGAEYGLASSILVKPDARRSLEYLTKAFNNGSTEAALGLIRLYSLHPELMDNDTGKILTFFNDSIDLLNDRYVLAAKLYIEAFKFNHRIVSLKSSLQSIEDTLISCLHATGAEQALLAMKDLELDKKFAKIQGGHLERTGRYLAALQNYIQACAIADIEQKTAYLKKAKTYIEETDNACWQERCVAAGIATQEEQPDVVCKAIKDAIRAAALSESLQKPLLVIVLGQVYEYLEKTNNRAIMDEIQKFYLPLTDGTVEPETAA